MRLGVEPVAEIVQCTEPHRFTYVERFDDPGLSRWWGNGGDPGDSDLLRGKHAVGRLPVWELLRPGSEGVEGASVHLPPGQQPEFAVAQPRIEGDRATAGSKDRERLLAHARKRDMRRAPPAAIAGWTAWLNYRTSASSVRTSRRASR